MKEVIELRKEKLSFILTCVRKAPDGLNVADSTGEITNRQNVRHLGDTRPRSKLLRPE